MLVNYYATLGIAPNASREAIRTAYLNLMRRYHPDRNPSAAAASYARDISAAYAVLGDPAKKARYDLERAGAIGVRVRAFASEPRERYLSPWLAAAFGMLAIAVLVPLLTPESGLPERAYTRTLGSRPVQASEASDAQAVKNPAALCASPAVASLVKRGLFNRAARLRGADTATFSRLAEASYIRFTSPALARPGSGVRTINCTASVAMDLPAGAAAYSGRRSVTGTVAYALAPSGSSSGGRLTLGAAETLTELLATVQSGTAAVDHVSPTKSEARPEEGPSAEPSDADLSPTRRSVAPPSAARSDQGRAVTQPGPSFSCRAISSWAAAAVCRSRQLASLDRHLASLYGDAMHRADTAQSILLMRADRRFLTRRDGCSSEACVESAYAAAMKEIEEVAAGRHQPR